MAFNVFLSHDTADFELVDEIYVSLSKIRGVEPYIYEKFPRYHKDIAGNTMDILRGCALCIVFLTRNGVASPWVNQEIGAAFALGKIVIVPVVEVGVEQKGFITFIPRIDYDPVAPLALDLLSYFVIHAVRTELLGQHDEIPEGLSLSCPQGHLRWYPLPSTDDINKAIDIIKASGLQWIIPYECPQCQAVIEISPFTLRESTTRY